MDIYKVPLLISGLPFFPKRDKIRYYSNPALAVLRVDFECVASARIRLFRFSSLVCGLAQPQHWSESTRSPINPTPGLPRTALDIYNEIMPDSPIVCWLATTECHSFCFHCRNVDSTEARVFFFQAFYCREGKCRGMFDVLSSIRLFFKLD